MRTEVMKILDLYAPIFAFSHCRDVVAAVSRAGLYSILSYPSPLAAFLVSSIHVSSVTTSLSDASMIHQRN